jgi:hypothetical protein
MALETSAATANRAGRERLGCVVMNGLLSLMLMRTVPLAHTRAATNPVCRTLS